MKSWKTTAAGVAAILTAIAGVLTGLSGDAGVAGIDWTSTIAAILAGVGLIASRDNNKSSEQVGAK